MTRLCDVVIATRNRPEALARSLAHLQRQTVNGFGVIVVDDFSDVPIEAPQGTGSMDVTVVRMSDPSGPAAARNAGVAASQADFIIFVDDDVAPSRNFVEAHLDVVTAADDPAHPIVSCGPFVQPADWDPTPWNLWEARQAKKEADALLAGTFSVSWRQFHTGNNCVPRDVFVELGGFDEGFKRAEDDEFGLRLERRGCNFRFVPDALAWHYSNRTLEAWLSIPRAYAYYDVDIDRRFPEVGYLATKKVELANRRFPLRVARRVFGGRHRSRLGVSAAVAAAQVLYRVGRVGPAMGALSVAYDLSYTQSLRATENAAAIKRVDPC